MIALTLDQIAAATGGRVLGEPGVRITGGVVLDSRAAGPGDLFVAVAGERVDGHDYADRAAEAGAVAVLGSRPTGAPTVVVDDPVRALGDLARTLLDALPRLTVLALTGSAGKTGTKDYLAWILRSQAPTVATAGNLNNELGVPLTVLRADAGTRYLVVEMGARGLGHIGYLCRVARPRVAAVLNVGTAHLSEFGSREAVAQAKGEIVESLPADGVAVLNADDPLTAAMATRTRARLLTFGRAAEVAWRDCVLDDLGRPSFELGYRGHWHPVRLQQVGAHQVPNATAAAAMALSVGLDLDTVAEALESAEQVSRWRMELRRRRDGALVVNDAYNANPESVTAALQALAEIGRRQHRRTVAVLGEMRELGAATEEAHRQVGRTAARLGIDVVVAVAAPAHPIAAGAADDPGWTGLALRTEGRSDAEAWVRQNVSADDVVLVKASRLAALEHVAAALLEHTDEEGDGR